MRLLLDTHALIWWLGGDNSLPITARAAIAEPANPVFVSAATAWEITTKHRIGKLALVAGFAGNFEDVILAQGFSSLPISLRHGQAAGSLPGPHRDPFDRMLIAQAMLENLVLVSSERQFDVYGVARLW